MNLREMECIAELAKTQSISKAAQNLYISQPALSQCLNRVELQLNTQLFTRSKNGLRPTYAGGKYIEMAKRVLRTYRYFEMDLCDINQMHQGRLRLGTSVHLGSLMLPEVLPKFNALYPNVEILVTETTSQQLEQYIVKGEIDISMMHLPFMEIEADYEKILRDRYVMAFSDTHRLNAYKYDKGDKFPYIDPTYAKDEKFISAFPHQRVRQICDIILKKAGVAPNIIIQSTSVQTALRLASVGVGMTLMPESYITLFNCPRKPVFCYLEDAFEAYWVFVVAYEKGSELSKPAREFIRILKESV